MRILKGGEMNCENHKMNCFVKNCRAPCTENFHCECKQEKKSCEQHKEIIAYQKVSCLVGFACLKCEDKNFVPRKIRVSTTIGIEYTFCGICAIEIIDPPIAEYLSTHEISVNPCGNEITCDLCFNKINPDNKGWTWANPNIAYNYCKLCISKKCSALIID